MYRTATVVRVEPMTTIAATFILSLVLMITPTCYEIEQRC